MLHGVVVPEIFPAGNSPPHHALRPCGEFNYFAFGHPGSDRAQLGSQHAFSNSVITVSRHYLSITESTTRQPSGSVQTLRTLQGLFRAEMEPPYRFQGLAPESPGQNLAWAVLCMPFSQLYLDHAKPPPPSTTQEAVTQARRRSREAWRRLAIMPPRHFHVQ